MPFINHDNSDEMIFLSQDLSKFFDSIDYELLCLTLKWLCMPPQVLQVIKSFYTGGRRLLTYRRETDGQWIQQERGILQGCPFSPLIAASFMKVADAQRIALSRFSVL